MCGWVGGGNEHEDNGMKVGKKGGGMDEGRRVEGYGEPWSNWGEPERAPH